MTKKELKKFMDDNKYVFINFEFKSVDLHACLMKIGESYTIRRRAKIYRANINVINVKSYFVFKSFNLLWKNLQHEDNHLVFEYLKYAPIENSKKYTYIERNLRNY